MKAHSVKRRVFVVVFSFSRVYARPWLARRLDDQVLAFSFLSVFVFRLWWALDAFRRESYIRRAFRHEPVLIGCRIHPETYVPVRRVSRLAEPGRTLDKLVQAASVSLGPGFDRGAGDL
jgi:hypothetical protein